MTTLIASVRTTLSGYLRYKGREGHLSFLLHRLTGLGTLLFLMIHIVDTSFAYFWPELYDHAIAIYRLTPFMIGEIFLVFSVIFHGVNGLRIAYVDMLKPADWTITKQRKAARFVLILSVLLWIWPAWVMFKNMLLHNFGIGG